MAVQADGRIVVAVAFHNGTTVDFALLRYHPDGVLDSSFDGDGLVITDINGMHNQARGLLLAAGGNIVVAGYSHLTADSDGIFTVARYNADGSLDATFAANGVALTPIGSADVGNAVGQQADGKLVLAGDSWNGTDIDTAVVRYLPNGALDPDFGNGGVVTTDMDGNHNGATAVAFQSDGRLLVAGYAVKEGNADMTVARYLTTAPVYDYQVYAPLAVRR